MSETENHPADAGHAPPAGKELLQRVRALVLESPRNSFVPSEVAERLGLREELASDCLEFLAELEREFEPHRQLRGVAKVLLNGKHFFEALSDNPDVRRDYDYRATNEGGRDFCAKNMLYYMWAWINMVEESCARHSLPNSRVVLLTHDCRFYPEETIAAAKRSAMLRGYKVVFAFADGTAPSCVSSYSHAVRIVRPVLAVFITASHVSRPPTNTVVGAKVSRLGPTGQLESFSTKDIKVNTARELETLKEAAELFDLLKPGASGEEIAVAESHTRLATAAVLAALRRLPGRTLYSLAEQLRTSPDINGLLSDCLPTSFSPPFEGLRIVVEGAHTSSGPLAEKAFRALGAQATLLHGEVRAVHGLHTADPSITRNLSTLFAQMRAQQAHMGVAFDLDGDRGAIVLPGPVDDFVVLAPDRLGQVLIPFLMDECGYNQCAKPLHVRDCLSTDAVLDQGKVSGVTVDTTDAGYVFLKKRENERARSGFVAISMGEASGHAWLHFTGPFENPIVLTLLFTALCAERIHLRKDLSPDGRIPALAVQRVFADLAIPYRKSTRFQPLFAPALVAEAARDPANDTGWSPDSHSPIQQKLISLCRSASIRKLSELFREGTTFKTPLGELQVDRFEAQWDEEEKIYRFGKIHFSLDRVPIGSFVSRGSSNDPTAVQVWEVKEFGGAEWKGVRLPEQSIQQRFDLIGGLVLSTCEEHHILELVDRPPAANMAEVLKSVGRYRELIGAASRRA